MKYLYCLVRGTDAPNGFPRGVGDTKIFPLHIEDISVLVSEVQGDVYPPQVDDVMAHHAVVRHALFTYSTVLPCRFGTVTATEQQAVALLRTRYPLLEGHLRFLEGKVEICIRALIPGPPQAPDSLRHAPQWQIPQQGTRYLLEKRLQYHRCQTVQTQAADLIQSFQVGTSAHLHAIKTEQHPLESGLLTTLYCLVQHQDLESFKHHYEYWRHGYRHVQFLYTGPWPPYTFAALDLREQESRSVAGSTDPQLGLSH